MNEKVQAILQKKGGDALLALGDANLRYLSGFTGGEGELLFIGEKQYLLTDSRYTAQAREETDGFVVIDIAAAEGYEKTLAALLPKQAVVVFPGGEISYRDAEKMKKELPGKTFVPLDDEMEELRICKEEWEIERIARAEAIGDEALDKLLPELTTGMTERQISAKLEFYMKELGAEALSFPSICASGPNSAKPHASPGMRAVQKGDFLTLDFGCKWQGYCSDMTRTVAFGQVSEKQREIYEIVLEAQLAGLDAVAPGKTGVEVDAVPRTLIAKAGYGDAFGHGLGHGVGLKIHEEPRLGKSGKRVLRPGMVVSVEPGIYLEGCFGVRIEDLVVVTEDGCRNLAHSPKELILL